MRLLLLFFLFLAANLPAQSQYHQGLLFGEVTMVDDQRLTGVIDWSDREMFWDDIFEASKLENIVLQHLSPVEIKRLSDLEKTQQMEWGFMRLWENKYPSRKHAFTCQFGDLRQLTVTGERSARLTFKNGESVEVGGESRDIGRPIYLYDKAAKRHKLDWGRMQTVRFRGAPDNFLPASLRPLHGTVVTSAGTFTGFVQWDLDENLASHRLEGKKDGKTKVIPFGKIAEIEKVQKNESRITLFSGEKMNLKDTDDVGPSNHGVRVKIDGFGQVEVKWGDFRSVRFSEKPPEAQVKKYGDFGPPRPLTGRLKTVEGETHRGKLIFDLDEQWDVEILDGKQDGLRYYIPFRNIRGLERKNHQYTAVTLKTGQKVLLTGHSDVTDQNWGLLIWAGKGKPAYLPWNKIADISLN